MKQSVEDKAKDSVRATGAAATSAQLLAQQHLRGVNVGLRAAPMDVSGMDLSSVQGITWRNLRALSGLIWTEHTVWPSAVADLVRERSIQIRPGSRDPALGWELPVVGSSPTRPTKMQLKKLQLT
jgi:hypothetical protein